jgi:general secretion pathway protein H
MAKKAAREKPVTSVTGNSGFTLLELLVVLGILVLITGAWPLATDRLFPTQQLRNESHRLLSTIRTVRTLARASGEIQFLEILPSTVEYRGAGEVHQLPKDMRLKIRGTDLTHEARLEFYPDGSSNGGTLDLALANRTQIIAVSGLTGHAEVLP